MVALIKYIRITLLMAGIVLMASGSVVSATKQSERGFEKNRVDDKYRGIELHLKNGEVVSLYKKSHALVIGAANYYRGWPKLYGTARDVNAVKKALTKHGFDVSVVWNPNDSQLRKAFMDFINTYGMDPENRLLFYFAGHGHTEKLAYGEEMGYIVPINAPNPEENKIEFLKKALDMQQIEVYAKRIQAKHALFVFDSCFSGSIFSVSRAIPKSISYKTTKPVRQFITSGSAEETVPDKSIFRAQFISALNGEGDLNEDGYITGSELGVYLESSVINYSKGSQHPQYGKIRNPLLDKGDFVFQIGEGIKPSAKVETAWNKSEESIKEDSPAISEPQAPFKEEKIEESSSNTLWHIMAVSLMLVGGGLGNESLNQSSELALENEDLQEKYDQAASVAERASISAQYKENQVKIGDLQNQAIGFYAVATIAVTWELWLLIFADDSPDSDAGFPGHKKKPFRLVVLPPDKQTLGGVSLRWSF